MDTILVRVLLLVGLATGSCDGLKCNECVGQRLTNGSVPVDNYWANCENKLIDCNTDSNYPPGSQLATMQCGAVIIKSNNVYQAAKGCFTSDFYELLFNATMPKDGCSARMQSRFEEPGRLFYGCFCATADGCNSKSTYEMAYGKASPEKHAARPDPVAYPIFDTILTDKVPLKEDD